jgi:alpha 1,3-glucosidase
MKPRLKAVAAAVRFTATTMLCLLILLSLVQSLTVVMAVDRSKFRTCQQTSFCRRHREARSTAAFDYALIPESIRFTRDSEWQESKEERNDDNGEKEESNAVGKEEESDDRASGLLPDGGSYYEKIKRLLLLSNKGHPHGLFLEKDNTPATGQTDSLDPSYRGIQPFFTASLVNRSPKSYWNGPESSSSEDLNLSIYLHDNGVARMRITEKYPTVASPEAGGTTTPRWTSDELILNYRQFKAFPMEHVHVLDKDELISLLQKVRLNPSTTMFENIDNCMAMRYGNLSLGSISNSTSEAKPSEDDDNVSVLLLVQFYPFALHMWRYSMDTKHVQTDSPIVSFNSDQLMHFEVRRKKEDDQVGIMHQTESHSPSQPSSQEDKHGGKEIVGYWEDGLAIYADGTREEHAHHVSQGDIDVSETAQISNNESSFGKSKSDGEFQVDTEGMWEEKFGDHVDSKPFGPMSVGGDIVFPQSKHLFGLPEHASGTQLKSTTGNGSYYKEPYRLYNLDVFEYELDETMSLYGEVPLIVSQSKISDTVGVFWFNPTETFVDVKEPENNAEGIQTHWISESGILDLFLLPGPSPKALYEQYGRLTGYTPMPPMFSLGYHQCRWNYRDEADVFQVDEKFDELDYPYDVLWLDIEHTDGKRYFTWDKNQFPSPLAMQEKLSNHGRKMVTIVDPHIKRDDNYYIHKEATAKGLYVKDKSSDKDYDGWCWPGSSSYLDFTDAKVRNWWADQFAYDKYTGSSSSLFIWNDMNEPSVFNGPEVSMQKDLRNLNGIEHREWHNLYGILFHRATSEGLIQRDGAGNSRSFVLSRSFFAGSQRYGAIWTGDNKSSWDHLKISTPMLLSLNVAALSFVGADVGGFFGNPDAELMTRWMQVGAYQPFFRGHAHHDAKRREPWMFGEEWMSKMRNAAIARYALLPYWYNVFRESNVSGMPVMR